jgi:hypothetical protein
MLAKPMLVPTSAGELVDTAIGIAKRYYPACLRVVLLPYLVAASFDYASTLPGAPGILTVINLLVTWVAGAMVEVALACASRDVLEGRAFGATPVAPIFRKRWAAIIFGHALKWIFVVFGFFMLILPGAYLMTVYFGVPYISAFEDVDMLAARDRSRELARLHLGRVFATIGVFDLAALSLGFGVIWVLGRGSLLQAPEWARSINWVLGLVIAPIRAALTAAVYLDCRIRSEGYDVDQAVAAVAPAGDAMDVA